MSTTTIHKETVHKEVHPTNPSQHARMSETRESVPVKDFKETQDLGMEAKNLGKNVKGFFKRNPMILQVAVGLALICAATYAAGYYGIGGDNRSVGEKMTDKLKSFPGIGGGVSEEQGNAWLPWNWKLWHRQPVVEPTLSEKFTGKDLEGNWKELQNTMLHTRKNMEESLKSSFDNFQTSMKNWWETWDVAAKQFKEDLAKKVAKTGSQLKEKLPESLKGGQTEHVHVYDPEQKTSTDTIKIHRHGYEKPEEEKKEKGGFFSKK